MKLDNEIFAFNGITFYMNKSHFIRVLRFNVHSDEQKQRYL